MVFSGYCTNVHAGNDIAAIQRNLMDFAIPIRHRLGIREPFPVGLWFPASAARIARREASWESFLAWFRNSGLTCHTLNGFPYRDFHEPVVKRRVYDPPWYDPRRSEFTRCLIEILDDLLEPASGGTISTLPLGWGQLGIDELAQSAGNLNSIAEELARIRDRSGKWIIVCLEPEPGCTLQRSRDVVEFFCDHLLPAGNEALIREHLAVCHDMCHAAVMMESQSAALGEYRTAGIRVAKVQVSSALRVAWHQLDADARDRARTLLHSFAEPRYLHQTTSIVGDKVSFFEDLSDTLADESAAHADEWRIHFHVPIFQESWHPLSTTQADIGACLDWFQAHLDPGPVHWEVETYAWNVLPEPFRAVNLVEGISREIEWLGNAFDARPPAAWTQSANARENS